ncbi:tripartite tricarboxylate transporter substrate binding protein [Ramlibacter sp. XY19]|uniref:Bug family tripartite tricarboxylate transporter substrate binding protein n=1 Tax=Ramlibacter paludis TaxID=2908000 RepID=UPI0023DC6EE7|nr:tripartite tricarboxylate transporter substrate binding protein [Ramlibacter paludis]MCG2594274.1 tripartite tricarboxylate transporter substrate binding protein [Ramlibacter paludis]
MKSHRRHLLALAAALCLAPAAFAQGNWPSKPITIVVSYPAGGDTDAMARLYAEKLTQRLGQPVIVDNKPGASGIIGSSFVAKAPADGYTLLMAPSTLSIATLVVKTGSGNAYDVLTDFTPIIQTATQPLFLVSSATGPKDMKELLSTARSKPMSYASPGSGSPMHILGELFNKSAGVKVSHVPYRGVAPAVNDVLGGHIPLTFITWGPVEPYVAGGKVHVLAVADKQRSPLAPNVPTLAELGVKDVEVGAWQGLLAPKGLPPEIQKTLNTHMNEILKMPDVVAKMKVFGALPAGGEPARLAKTTADDNARFGKIIKDFGISAD